MKLIYPKAIAGLCLLSCGNHTFITIENSTDEVVTEGIVTVNRASFTSIDDQLPVLSDEQGNLVPTQFEDADRDGRWDEVLFQYSLGRDVKTKLNVSWMPPEEYPEFKPRTKVYLGYSPKRNDRFEPVDRIIRAKDHLPQTYPLLYQFEGPGWESELVAYRSYFDSRNGKDIFGKTQPALVTPLIGTDGNYHKLRDWGMDVLKVGSSLGAGALALLKQDSIYRLGETQSAAFEVLTNGPVKSSLKLSYMGWEVGDNTYDLFETISIYSGKRWYRSETELINGQETDTLVTGLVNFKNLALTSVEVDGWRIFYTHGKQSENSDVLGMSILVPLEYYAGIGETPPTGTGVTNTSVVYLKPVSGKYLFYFFSGWELENSSFADENYFRDQLIQEANSIDSRLKFELKK